MGTDAPLPPPPSWCFWSLCLLRLPTILTDGGQRGGREGKALGQQKLFERLKVMKIRMAAGEGEGGMIV